MNYYNEIDKGAAAWIRELIAMGEIPAGDVDERSIADVMPRDLDGYTQCHFFAGISGWSYALKLAGWDSTRPVWTGSCPCTPFSQAGRQKGFDDPRHLWPEWFRLIRECRPTTIIGEQVAAAIGHGWLDLVATDLEGESYAIGSAILGAHSAGAPHRRQRLYFVAHHNGKRCDGGGKNARREARASAGVVSRCEISPMADDNRIGQQRLQPSQQGNAARFPESGDRGTDGGMVNNVKPGLEGHIQYEHHSPQSRWFGAHPAGPTTQASHTNPWADAEWMLCKDDKYRAVKSKFFEMVDGLSCKMVCCCYPATARHKKIQKEMIYAKKTTTKPRKLLPCLRNENGKKKIWANQNIRRHGSFSVKKILQPKVYGERTNTGNSNESTPQQGKSASDDKGFMRGVWENTQIACPSCGLQSFKQYSIEFDDIVQQLSPQRTLASLLGSGGAEYMQILRKTSDEKRSLLDSQYPLSKIWESLNDQDKERVKIHFNNGTWIVSESIQPLAPRLSPGMVYGGDHVTPEYANNTQEARKTRIKGYGNAIVPQTAALFIQAYMDTQRSMTCHCYSR